MRRLSLVFFLAAALASALSAQPIDRRALVTRHNPTLTKVDAWAPVSVGNGRFAFTADVTGLQTFADHYQTNGIPLNTLARWAWHEAPNPEGFKLADTYKPYDQHGRTINFAVETETPAGRYLRSSPRVLPLAQLALDFTRATGTPLKPDDIRAISQSLDLWSGTVTSRFTLVGLPVTVTTACDPATDTLSVRVNSPHVTAGKLGVRLTFPRGFNAATAENPALDWTQPETHRTTVTGQTDRSIVLVRTRDTARYHAALATTGPARFTPTGPHGFVVRAASGDTLEFTLAFGAEATSQIPAPAAVRIASATQWGKFWSTGGAVDFTGSTDPRAAELERRVVLSQYLTALQNGGDLPPSSGGLTVVTADGKHASEQLWCLQAHFALWGRDEALARSLAWYQSQLPAARALGAERGRRGARWPALVGPDGRETPGRHTLVISNQPHIVQLAELLYRNSPTTATLERYRELVQETAEGMASMLFWDKTRSVYGLGPPVAVNSGDFDPATGANPTYELALWSRGLEIAQEWRDRLGLAREGAWEKMRNALAPLPQKDGRYVTLETKPDTWDHPASRRGCPSFLMAFGRLPGTGVDRAIMRRTLDATLANWDWATRTNGRDYPIIAMTAARLGAPKLALDILFKSDANNTYHTSGHNPQAGGSPVHLAANGALLSALAMMAGGWDDSPPGTAPGFPRDGSWTVRAEGLSRLP